MQIHQNKVNRIVNSEENDSCCHAQVQSQDMEAVTLKMHKTYTGHYSIPRPRSSSRLTISLGKCSACNESSQSCAKLKSLGKKTTQLTKRIKTRRRIYTDWYNYCLRSTTEHHILQSGYRFEVLHYT